MSEEHNACNYYYVQSADRLSTETASNFTVPDQNFGNASSLEIQQVILPYTFYSVDAYHVDLAFQINGSGVTIIASIAPGNYSISSFQTALQNAMALATGSTQTYIVVISTITGLVTITQNSGTFIIMKSLTTSTINKIAGFNTTDTTGAIAHTSDYPVNLGGTDYIDIFSSHLLRYDTRSLDTSSKGTTRLLRVPIKDYSWGGTITYFPFFHMINHKPEQSGTIDFQLKDMYGNLINLNGRDWVFKLKYHTDRPHRKHIRAGKHDDYFGQANLLSSKN